MNVVLAFRVLFLVGMVTFVMPDDALGQVSRFTGHWVNVDPKNKTLAEVSIVQQEGKKVAVDLGSGPVELTVYAPTVESNPQETATTLIATMQAGNRLLLFRIGHRDVLQVDMFTRFTDGSPRANYTVMYTFRRSAANRPQGRHLVR